MPVSKTGRPRIREKVQRSEVIGARMTLEEAATVRANADRAGLSVSDYCRRVILKHRVLPAITDRDEAALAELNRIGVNLNQIARAANRGEGLPPELGVALAALHAAIERLLEPEQ